MNTNHIIRLCHKSMMLSRFPSLGNSALWAAFVLLLMLPTVQSFAAYEYSSVPAIGSYTYTGSGETEGPNINYSTGEINGSVIYTNGQFKVTLQSINSPFFIFHVAKESGYFTNGNRGRVFVVESDMSVTYKTFNITNSTTSGFDIPVQFSDFNRERSYSFYLVTGDQLYK